MLQEAEEERKLRIGVLASLVDWVKALNGLESCVDIFIYDSMYNYDYYYFGKERLKLTFICSKLLNNNKKIK